MIDACAEAPNPCRKRRIETGRRAHLSGAAAEDMVARRYAKAGAQVLERRWRGRGGELDLVVQDGPDLVVVEVKRARSFARAAERVTPSQVRRIMAAASEFIGTRPLGQLTPLRFDLAMVDGYGRTEIIEGAFGT